MRHIGKPAKRLSPDGYNAFVAICGFGATFEQNRVAGLERQRSDLRNDIGPRFKYHRNHTKRAGFFVQDQPWSSSVAASRFPRGSGRFATSRMRAAIRV